MLTVRPYQTADQESWDALCAQAEQATLLHTRCFLSYHGDRFVDRSLLIEENGTLLGLFPAAEHPSDRSHVVSHPGVTYGGVVHAGALRGELMLSALAAVTDHFSGQGYARLTYKVVPAFYHRIPSQDDLYALFRLGAVRVRCDLSSTIDLSHRGPVSQRRRRSLKKAQKAGVGITTGAACLPALWEVLAENLARKHDVSPVHSIREIILLSERFPENIECVCAQLDGEVVAGALLFITPTAHHAQYIASSEAGYRISALDMVFEYCIEQAGKLSKKWFDFGISTEASGKQLNDGLYGFKTEFGSGGFVHEFYEMKLESFNVDS